GVAEVRRPDPTAGAVYAELRPVFESAHDALAPIFARLRRVDAGRRTPHRSRLEALTSEVEIDGGPGA
ncbi:MAG TPA: hypothetical protein VGE42_00970, partial [Candidatus Dormibacteraeota bacterium]